ncbi:hypothetical protein FOIG_08086 [Fusarium odoratissimum NRRL 54006]|uniref:Uncharacterized protein n=2 Tax=Fusarium oxysporum species complex TaxID=171631 RepID=X0JU61_FUSO5|nr:uncharacterized protein FOIG_08086 [Fusarium odoratissimum NRRL 54006]EXM00012.1 hypothetical protein FOIG_08086 [Fusarium odoratissimum NRRL 54006]TXC11152.1 hypothetical protein FocTR4_00006461 [Fusarium oxysporum f. sp. cubense]
MSIRQAIHAGLTVKVPFRCVVLVFLAVRLVWSSQTGGIVCAKSPCLLANINVNYRGFRH